MVDVSQVRTASGLGDPKKLISSTSMLIEEESTTEHSYTLIVRSVGATGEESQRVAAQRLTGRRLVVDLADGKVRGDAEAFSGTQDVAAADIGMLFVLFAPVIPSPRADEGDRWRAVTEPVTVPWSSPLRFTIDHRVIGRVIGKEKLGNLDTARVKSVALGNVDFKLPLVVPAPGVPGRAPATTSPRGDDLIVNQLFEALFADIDNPIEGLAAAIAAIPLAIAAPFLAIGEAIAGLFTSSGSDEPEEVQAPVVDLSGPIELRSDTQVWTADGRVLSALGRGKMSLVGAVSELPGAAAQLSGKTLRLDVTWKMDRTHGKPLPAPRDPPGRGPLPIIALLVAALALALTSWRMPPRRLLRPKR